jgi:hypothetical protein
MAATWQQRGGIIAESDQAEVVEGTTERVMKKPSGHKLS